MSLLKTVFHIRLFDGSNHKQTQIQQKKTDLTFWRKPWGFVLHGFVLKKSFVNWTCIWPSDLGTRENTAYFSEGEGFIDPCRVKQQRWNERNTLNGKHCPKGKFFFHIIAAIWWHQVLVLLLIFYKNSSVWQTFQEKEQKMFPTNPAVNCRFAGCSHKTFGVAFGSPFWW